MHVIAGPLRQPGAHLRVLVGGVVVHDEVHVELLRDRFFDVAQKLEKLLMAMPVLALSDHATRGDIECRQRGWSFRGERNRA